MCIDSHFIGIVVHEFVEALNILMCVKKNKKMRKKVYNTYPVYLTGIIAGMYLRARARSRFLVRWNYYYFNIIPTTKETSRRNVRVCVRVVGG